MSQLNALQKVTISTASGTTRTIEYKIDGENKRSIKKVNGTVVAGYLYDSQKRLVAELNGQLQLKHRFVYATQSHSPDYMIEVATGNKYFFVKDHLGSILSVVDINSGVAVQEISYDEFGIIESDSNPGFQPFGFAGGHFDSDTGLVRFGARDYNSETGRWMERDPILFEGKQSNLWSYVDNDPVNRVDPLGTLLHTIAYFAAREAFDSALDEYFDFKFYGKTLYCWHKRQNLIKKYNRLIEVIDYILKNKELPEQKEEDDNPRRYQGTPQKRHKNIA